MATAEKNQNDAIKQLSSDVETLRADIGQLVSSLKNAGVASGQNAVDTAQVQAEKLRGQISDMSSMATASAQDVSLKAENAIKEQPFPAVLLAAAAGLAFGYVTAKK